MKEFTCRRCGKTFCAEHSGRKWCDECKLIVKREQSLASWRRCTSHKKPPEYALCPRCGAKMDEADKKAKEKMYADCNSDSGGNNSDDYNPCLLHDVEQSEPRGGTGRSGTLGAV